MLPEGFEVVRDSDGDWVLIPPENVTIFSVPGEPWLITDMKGDSEEEAVELSVAYLKSALA